MPRPSEYAGVVGLERGLSSPLGPLSRARSVVQAVLLLAAYFSTGERPYPHAARNLR